MRVLGIDPGTLRLGWGIAEKAGTRLTHVAHGTLRLDPKAPLAARLVGIERELERLLDTYEVQFASIESIFFAKDAQAAAKLGHARGVALLICARRGLEIYEYAPAKVKQTVAGGGRADKNQVARMVRALFGLVEIPAPDAADALAIALTHLQRGYVPAPVREKPLGR